MTTETKAPQPLLPPPSTTEDWLSSSTTPTSILPDLMSVLRNDNKSIVTEILNRPPGRQHQPETTTTTTTSSPPPPPITWFQRLVFDDDQLRNLILRHVLGDPGTWNGTCAVATAKRKKKKKRDEEKTTTTKKKDSYEAPYPKGLNITSSLLLDEVFVPPSNDTEVEFDSFAVDYQLDPSLEEEDGTTTTTQTTPPDVVLYFLRPSPHRVRKLSFYIKHLQARGSSTRSPSSSTPNLHRLVFVPYCTALCERILLEEGISGMERVSIEDMRLDLIPLDHDILSIELPHTLSEADAWHCPSACITAAAKSVRKLQSVCGIVPRIQGLGPLAEAVIAKSMSLRLEECAEGEGEEEEVECQIDAMIVIDRKVDLVTPMLTPLTYEGLIDEILDIDIGFVKVEASLVEPEAEAEANTINPDFKHEKVDLALNGSDSLYAEVRNQNVEKFGKFLQDQAIALKESHSNFSKDKGLSEIHEFVKQIPIFTQNLRSLTQHIHLAEVVKQTTDDSAFRQKWLTERAMLEGETCYDTLEDLIACQEPFYSLLRLLCLQSLTSGGIKSSKWDFLRRELVQTYGYESLFVLQNLEKIGLLRRREMSFMDTGSPFSTLRKLLVLINAEVNSIDPNDIAYVSSGYAPLTTRLVQTATAQGWTEKNEIIKELPGRLIDIVQNDTIPEELEDAMKRGPGIRLGTEGKRRGDGKKPVLVVYYVGGVTFMEIAALRFLSQRVGFPYRIVCCTTKIVNGTSFLKSLG